jgi:hypothetical protein
LGVTGEAPSPFHTPHVTDYEVKLLEVLEKLVDSSSLSIPQKDQCVFVTILQTNGQAQFPSLEEACREFELRCDISPDFFVNGRKTPKSIQLKYVIPTTSWRKLSLDSRESRSMADFFRLFTRCPQIYKLNIFGFSRNVLNDEAKIRNKKPP